MENEQTLTGEQSLELITSMIKQAKNDYYDTGISALLWGSVIIFCSLATYANHWLKWGCAGLYLVPDHCRLRSAGHHIDPRSEARGYKSYQSDLIGGIWLSYAIAIFLFSYLAYALNIAKRRADLPDPVWDPDIRFGYGAGSGR